MGRETNKSRRQTQAQSAREKAAAARQAQQQIDQRRRAMVIISSVVVVALLVVIIVVIAVNSGGNKKSPNDRVAASPAVVAKATSVSPATLQAVGKGSSYDALKAINDPAYTVNGKPAFLYIGGEFCPYCAGERWAMVQAMSKFGHFSNLSEIHSAVDDGNLATFSFYQSTYTSKYVSFTPVEAVDRNHKTLEKISASQLAIFKKYSPQEQFPFMYLGGKYWQDGAGLDVGVLSGLTQAQIAGDLDNPSSKVAQAIDGEANVLTAAVCKLTGGKPGSVCNSSTVTSLQSGLGA